MASWDAEPCPEAGHPDRPSEDRPSDRPEAGRGVIQAFRRAGSSYETARIRPRGLDPAARYRLKDLDHPSAPREVTGRELMETGLELAIALRPGSAVLTYEKLPAR